MNSVLSSLQKTIQTNLPFVFYRKPNEKIVHSITTKTNNLYSLTNFNQKGFVFAPFNKQENTIIFPLEVSNIFSWPYESTVNTDTNNLVTDNTYEKNHLQLVQKGIEYIIHNKTPKIVLSRQEKISKKVNIISTFKNLLNKYKTAFVYIWYHPKVGLWLGATPETLINISNKSFKTMALAGTQVYYETMDVTWGEKEIQEHQFVTDYICSQLSNKQITHKVSKTNTVKAGNLLHIHATITGRLSNNLQIGNLIETLHPTPAVCGYPKKKAEKFIIENENYNREFYTGFLGELNFQNDKRKKNNNKRNIENHAYTFATLQSSLFVNLRCMQVKKDKTILYIGGGITKDSNPKNEYLETVAKSEVMKSILCFE